MTTSTSSGPHAEVGRPIRSWPAALLTALTVVVTLESFRLLFPSLYGLKERTTLLTVLIAFVVVAFTPLLSPLFARILGTHRALALFVLLLAAWRVVVQLIDPVTTGMAAAGSIVALVALTLLLSGPLPGGSFSRAAGLFSGLALDVILSGAFGTWEPAWQAGIAPLAVAAALAAALVACAVAAYLARDPARADEASGATASGGIAVGAVVALEVLFLANSAYVAAAGGLALSWAVAVTAAGTALALAACVIVRLLRVLPTAVAVAVLVAAGFLLPAATSAPAVAAVLIAQLGAGIVVGRALAPARRRPIRAGVGLAVGWLLALVVILLFQLHFDSPLLVDNRYLTALLGLLAALALLGPHAPASSEPNRRWLLVSAVAIAAGVVVAVALATTGPSPASAAAAPDESVRVLQWNVRYGVDEAGQLDPETIAETIEAQGEVDVVVLNEVGRGWPLSGQLDLASWMSRRLGLHSVWGAAASAQAGNLVLSRYPVVASEVVALPKAGRSMGRSLVYAMLDRGEGEALEILATHLQHRNDAPAMQARLQEVDRIVEFWHGSPATVLAGDLNPKQGDPPDYPVRRPGEFAEIAVLLEAGFATAANLQACDPPTSNDNCSDYILAGPGLTEDGYKVGDLFADHRLLIADVTGF